MTTLKSLEFGKSPQGFKGCYHHKSKIGIFESWIEIIIQTCLLCWWLEKYIYEMTKTWVVYNRNISHSLDCYATASVSFLPPHERVLRMERDLSMKQNFMLNTSLPFWMEMVWDLAPLSIRYVFFYQSTRTTHKGKELGLNIIWCWPRLYSKPLNMFMGRLNLLIMR